jgi:hypothetical protein
MGTPAPDAVKRLVDLFDRERRVYQSPDYKEEQLRAEFLNPFFESLGWGPERPPRHNSEQNSRRWPTFPRSGKAVRV